MKLCRMVVLPGAVGPDERNFLAAGDGERDVVEDLTRAVVLFEVDESKHVQ